jgi:hypothetical protein
MTIRRELNNNGKYKLRFSTKSASEEVVANKPTRMPALKPKSKSKGIKM